MRFSLFGVFVLTTIAAIYLALIQAGPVGFLVLAIVVTFTIRQFVLFKRDIDQYLDSQE